MMKKRIFIGSSIESKEIAYRIQAAISDQYDCVLWYEGFFSLGDHYYTDLIQKIVTFDYAIMIGGVDDVVIRISNNARKQAPRDNVYLEYGLFSGILSPKRVLLLMDEMCVPASDLSGMSLARYHSVDHAVELVKNWLGNDQPDRVLSGKNVELLPTVGVAVGYYYNFVKPFVLALCGEKEISADFKLHICFPEYVCDDVDYYKQVLMAEKSLTEKIVSRYRILVDENALDTLRLYDVPGTILTLFKTVDYIFGIQDGNTEDTLYAKQKALQNFRDNVKTMILNDFRVKKHIVFDVCPEVEY